MSLNQQSCTVSFNLCPTSRAKATKVIMPGNVMSGSQRLGPACLSIASSTRWSVQPADEKFLWKTSSTQTAVSCLCWCVEPHYFSHLLLVRQKDEYFCPFLETVPSLVSRHLLQPVFWLLLRLTAAAAAAAVVVVPLLLLLPQNNLQNR